MKKATFYYWIIIVALIVFIGAGFTNKPELKVTTGILLVYLQLRRMEILLEDRL